MALILLAVIIDLIIFKTLKKSQYMMRLVLIAQAVILLGHRHTRTDPRTERSQTPLITVLPTRVMII